MSRPWALKSDAANEVVAIFIYFIFSAFLIEIQAQIRILVTIKSKMPRSLK